MSLVDPNAPVVVRRTHTPLREPPIREKPASADPLSFAMLAAVLRRRWRLFLVVFGLSVAASLIAALLLPRQYSATTSLMIDPRPGGSPVTSRSKNTLQPDATVVDTEVKVITSPMTAQAVVARLKLDQDPEFAGEGGRTPAALADSLAEHVDVYRDGLTYMVAIRARSRSPQKAAAIANAMAQAYLVESRRALARLASDQARNLTGELADLGRQVIAADAAVADFRAAHGLVGREDGGAGTVNDQQISTVAGELGRATAEAANARAVAVTARGQADHSSADTVTQVLSSGALMELRNQRAQVLREQARVATIYGPEHPASIRINQQMDRLDREIRTEGRRVVRGLDADARAAGSRVQMLNGKLAALQVRQEEEAKAAVIADGLKRDADAKRATFNELSQNALEEAQAARIGDVRAWQVTEASPPTRPSFPRKSIFMMIGAIFGVALGGGAVVAAELRESGFRSADEVAAELALPLLAAIPEPPASGGELQKLLPARGGAEPQSHWDYVIEKPASSFAEALRSLRASLLEAADGRDSTVVCITSALPGEGKSLTTVALARVMAMSGDRVLLIDCDLRRSGLTRLRRERLGDEDRPGLMEVLDGRSAVDAATVEDVVAGVSVLGLDEPTFTSRDVFSRSAAQHLLAELKPKYDFIILDAPPVLAVADACALSRLSDITVLVVRHAKTARAAVRAATERLRHQRSSIGVVFNRGASAWGEDAGRYDSIYAPYFRE